jgi:hypothetical protein
VSCSAYCGSSITPGVSWKHSWVRHSADVSTPRMECRLRRG